MYRYRKILAHVGITAVVTGLLFTPPGIFLWGVAISLLSVFTSITAAGVVVLSFLVLFAIGTAIIYMALYYYRNKTSSP